jgi:hypothetical protein
MPQSGKTNAMPLVPKMIFQALGAPLLQFVTGFDLSFQLSASNDGD